MIQISLFRILKLHLLQGVEYIGGWQPRYVLEQNLLTMSGKLIVADDLNVSLIIYLPSYNSCPV